MRAAGGNGRGREPPGPRPRSAEAPKRPKGARAGERRRGGRRRGLGARGAGAAAVQRRAAEVLARLKAAYPEARCALEHRNAYELLCATILSAQCTDARVNMVTPALFAKYPTPAALAEADPAELEEVIRSTGFFRSKARSLIGMARALVAEHGGEVPASMDALRLLPGVGRKTANVILGNAFGMNEGITVDTHVTRLSRLLGLTRQADAETIEADLIPLFPRDDWALVSHVLIFHGRQVCVARRPRCPTCVLADLCPSAVLG